MIRKLYLNTDLAFNLHNLLSRWQRMFDFNFLFDDFMIEFLSRRMLKKKFVLHRKKFKFLNNFNISCSRETTTKKVDKVQLIADDVKVRIKPVKKFKFSKKCDNFLTDVCKVLSHDGNVKQL